MRIINFIKNIFADDTKEEILRKWHRILELPNWIGEKHIYNSNGNNYIKGHTFLYKIKPVAHGKYPGYYRRLRHKQLTLEKEEIEKRFAEIYRRNNTPSFKYKQKCQ